MSTRDAYLQRETLRTGRPEPHVNPESKPVRRCERCGCKLATDNPGLYHEHYLCSPCLRPIATVADSIPAEQRRRIVALCSGYTNREVADKLGCGLSTPAGSVFAAAGLCSTSTAHLRVAVSWALEHGVLRADPDFPLRMKHAPVVKHKASEEQRERAVGHARKYQEHADAGLALMPQPAVGHFLGSLRCAYDLGRAEATAEALEAQGK